MILLLDLFRKKRICQHPRVTPEADIAYCPDCGELVENQWYLSRCSCCGIKLKSMIKNNEIVTECKFCHNCGCNTHITEQIDKINFIDINFAVLVKNIVQAKMRAYTQSWVEPNVVMHPKLIAQYRS